MTAVCLSIGIILDRSPPSGVTAVNVLPLLGEGWLGLLLYVSNDKYLMF